MQLDRFPGPLPQEVRRGTCLGCTLSPILFALYVADMSKDLHESGLGVKLHRFTKHFLSYIDGSSAFLMEVYLA